MFDPAENVPIQVSSDSVSVYGTQFAFRQGDKKGRNAAIRDAKKHGAERQAIMRQQAGRSLTIREQIRGELDLPAKKKPTVLFAQPSGHDPNVNPWRNRLDELRRQPALTRDEKARLRARMDFVLAQAEQWDAAHAAQQAIANEPENDDLVRLRKHAVESYEMVRNDPTATVADIVARKRLLKMSQSDDVEPGSYWHEVRLLESEQDQSPKLEATPLNPIYKHQ